VVFIDKFGCWKIEIGEWRIENSGIIKNSAEHYRCSIIVGDVVTDR
jgi:hypothetical protein